MHRNPVWLGLLIFIALVTLWYAFDAGVKVYRYAKLSEETTATEVAWSVRKVAGPRFIPHIRFHYVVEGEDYQGETTLNQYPSRSGWGAEEVIKDLDRTSHTIWYDGQNRVLAVYDKQFPSKECLYTAALLGMLAYFLWIGSYVKRGCKI